MPEVHAEDDTELSSKSEHQAEMSTTQKITPKQSTTFEHTSEVSTAFKNGHQLNRHEHNIDICSYIIKIQIFLFVNLSTDFQN